MRVAIVTCVYSPEPVVSGRTSREIAEALVARGDDVTVLAPFPNRPAGRLLPGYRRRPFTVERGRPRVVRCFGTFSRSSGTASRLLENLSFGVTAALALLGTARPDVVYSNTWPVLATGLVHAVARLRGIPVVLNVQDLYPESLVAQGRASQNHPVVRVLRVADRRIARASRFVIVLSERLAAAYAQTRELDEERVRVVPNWVDPALVPAPDARRRFRARFGAEEHEKLVVYAGNLGAAAGLDVVFGAAKRLRSEDAVRLVIAGSGPELPRVRSAAAALDDGRVVVHSPWPVEESADLLEAADAFLLPTAGGQSRASVPSKLLAYLLAGRPIVAAALPGSDLEELVLSSGAGWVIPPGESEPLAAALRRIGAMTTEELATIGEAGRRYARSQLTREACLPRILQTIDAAAGAAK